MLSLELLVHRRTVCLWFCERKPLNIHSPEQIHNYFRFNFCFSFHFIYWFVEQNETEMASRLMNLNRILLRGNCAGGKMWPAALSSTMNSTAQSTRNCKWTHWNLSVCMCVSVWVWAFVVFRILNSWTATAFVQSQLQIRFFCSATIRRADCLYKSWIECVVATTTTAW